LGHGVINRIVSTKLM